MKTTVELPDALVAEAKEVAARRGTTLRGLVEMGLRVVIERPNGSRPFRLRDASFTGNGLQPEFRDGDWERIRAAANEGRGG